MINEVNTDWLIESGEPLPPTNEVQLKQEVEMLKDLASNVGLYDYNYTDEAVKDPTLPTDNEEHIGIMAQQLLKVPGLASAVSTTTDENGNETYVVDGVKVALASLGYIAALTKIVLDMRGIEYANSSSDNVEPVQNERDTGVQTTSGAETAYSRTEENGLSKGGISNGSAVQTADSSELDSTATATGLNASVYDEVK